MDHRVCIVCARSLYGANRPWFKIKYEPSLSYYIMHKDCWRICETLIYRLSGNFIFLFDI